MMQDEMYILLDNLIKWDYAKHTPVYILQTALNYDEFKGPCGINLKV